MQRFATVKKKRCSKCLTYFPATIEFFHGNGDGKSDLRARCKSCESARRSGKTFSPPKPELATKLVTAQRYVVTYAQNATPVHEGFLAALQTYCTENDAVLVVIPGRYHNPTSLWSRDAQHADWWDAAVVPYLFAGRHTIAGAALTIYGDMSIQPTAERPLSGLQIFAGGNSAVFGHPRLQFVSVATATRQARFLTTTGACTIPNYTDSKIGKKAEAHHVLGASVVEIEAKRFHVRQLNANDTTGAFIDLDREYTATGSKAAPHAAALILGDIHVDKKQQAVLDATLYAANSIAATVKPELIVYHDVLDFAARNHHHRNDPMDRYKRATGRAVDSIEAELKDVLAFLQRTPAGAQPIVVASNHDDAFDRWLRDTDPRTDPVNASLYHRMWHKLIEALDRKDEWVPALELYCELEKHMRTRFIRRNEDFRIKDIVCGLHGDKGINGARGTVAAYAKLGVKTVVGHHHTPYILDGCYAVGVTGSLDHGYNFLPSSWAHSHVIIYSNGKRTLVHVIDGTWRAGEKRKK